MSTPSDTPTPRTDAAQQFVYGHIDKYWIDPYFARQLERELAAATKERDALREEVARLKSKPRVEQCCECHVYVSDWVEAEHTNGRICRPCDTLIAVRQRLTESEKARQEAEAKLNKQNDTIGFLDLEIKAERVAHEETKKALEKERHEASRARHLVE